MKKAVAERELLTIIKQIEDDLSRPRTPREMQGFIDESLAKLHYLEKRVNKLIHKKEAAFFHFMFDIVIFAALIAAIVFIINN